MTRLSKKLSGLGNVTLEVGVTLSNEVKLYFEHTTTAVFTITGSAYVCSTERECTFQDPIEDPHFWLGIHNTFLQDAIETHRALHTCLFIFQGCPLA